MTEFHETTPTLENCWRSVILFGRNVASYKFALGKALLELGGHSDDLIRMQDLARPFAQHLASHLKRVDKQATSRSSKFLDVCRRHNTGKVGEDELITSTTRLGFANVIDAFHIVNQRELPVRFFLDERTASGGIRLTEDFRRLHVGEHAASLPAEVEARWRLVETAWELDVSRRLITVEHDAEGGSLFVRGRDRRVDITSCRDALNGYQKGWCFYCFDRIGIASGDTALADVDHFFPHLLKTLGAKGLDGVWNLVLACQNCNRGERGKFARVPSTILLARLHRRNEYLIDSHHPLRETLIGQTGISKAERRAFLQARHDEAIRQLIHVWPDPEPRRSAAF